MHLIKPLGLGNLSAYVVVPIITEKMKLELVQLKEICKKQF